MPPLCFRGCTKIEVYSVHLCILPNIEFIALFSLFLWSCKQTFVDCCRPASVRSSGPKEKRMCGVVDGGGDKDMDKTRSECESGWLPDLRR